MRHVSYLANDTSLPDDLQSFLKNDDNKTDLNKLVTQECLNVQTTDYDKEIVVSFNHSIKSKSDGVQDIFRWIEDTHEEADNRMIIHIEDMLKHDICSITVRSVDTDVLINFNIFYVPFPCDE